MTLENQPDEDVERKRQEQLLAEFRRHFIESLVVTRDIATLFTLHELLRTLTLKHVVVWDGKTEVDHPALAPLDPSVGILPSRSPERHEIFKTKLEEFSADYRAPSIIGLYDEDGIPTIELNGNSLAESPHNTYSREILPGITQVTINSSGRIGALREFQPLTPEQSGILMREFLRIRHAIDQGTTGKSPR